MPWIDNDCNKSVVDFHEMFKRIFEPFISGGGVEMMAKSQAASRSTQLA